MNYQETVIDIFAWLGFILITMALAHLLMGKPIFTDYGWYYCYANIIGAVFGIIAGKYLLAWYQSR